MLALLLLLLPIAVHAGFGPYPPYPGTEKNAAGLNITFPTTGSFYNVQQQSVKLTTGYNETSNKPITENVTRWVPAGTNKKDWAITWQFSDDFIAKYIGSNVTTYGLNNSAMRIGLMRADNSSSSTLVSADTFSFLDATCKQADPTAAKKYPDHSCATALGDRVELTNAKTLGDLEPADNYYVAILNDTSTSGKSATSQANYVVVSSLFSLKNSTAPDASIPSWYSASGAFALTAPAALVVSQLALAVLFAL